MTHIQQLTLDEMRRQGLQIESHDAEQCWRRKSTYEIDALTHIPGELQDLIHKSNHDIK